MSNIERSVIVACSPQQMYDLVNDIETYPDYMPGCLGAAITGRGDDWIEARLELGQGSFRQAFTTRNTLVENKEMQLTLVDGPFKRFEGRWRFDPIQAEGCEGCKVTFTLSFQFANMLMGLAASKTIERVASEQVDAVCERARQLYATG